MSYAEAARSKFNDKTKNTHKDYGFGKYFNEKLLVCQASGFTCEDVADVLHKEGLLQVVSGLQSFDFYRKIGIVVEDEKVREFIACNGLVTKEHHRTFDYHKRKEIHRVYVSQLCLGISGQEVRVAFTEYGSIDHIQPVTKKYHDLNLDTGNWCIYFNILAKPIPSYVSVRGWRAYVNYFGQPKTCRICDGQGHLARDCPTNRKENDQDLPMDMNSQQPSAQASSPEPEAKTPEKPAESASDSDSLFSDLDMPKKSLQREIFGTETEISVHEMDRDSKSTAWADDIEEDSKAQEDANKKVESVTSPKPYCPRCREYTHTEAQCIADVLRLANKRKSSDTEEGKPGKSGKKDFKSFKSDLAQVVLRGRRVDEFQYILERDDYNEVCTYYMVVHFGALSGTLATTNSEHKMAGNTEAL